MYWNMSIQCLMAFALIYTILTTHITVVLIPDRFQIPKGDAAITTRAQSSLESFQTTGNHTKFPVSYIKVDETCLLKQTDIHVYTHI